MSNQSWTVIQSLADEYSTNLKLTMWGKVKIKFQRIPNMQSFKHHIMVLILDDTSVKGAISIIWSVQGIWLNREQSQIRWFYKNPNRSIFLHACARCSGLLCNISIIHSARKWNFDLFALETFTEMEKKSIKHILFLYLP